MEVIVNCSGGFKPFLLKVSHSDSVGKIKEKIEKQQGIPISRQSICFNDEILPDDFNVRDSRIIDGSTLLLLLPADQGINVDDNNQFHPPLPADDPCLQYLNSADLLKSPTVSGVSNSDILYRYPTDFPQFENPLQRSIFDLSPADISAPDFASNILDRYPISLPQFENPFQRSFINESPAYIDAPLPSSISEQPRNQFPFPEEMQTTLLHHKLPDSRESTVESGSGSNPEKLKEKMSGNDQANDDSSEVAAEKRAAASAAPRRRAATMNVVVRQGGRETKVGVRRDEAVTELRGRLRELGFTIPEPCFYIHDQRVMDDDKSFGWHSVEEGDLIEPFAGYYKIKDSD